MADLTKVTSVNNIVSAIADEYAREKLGEKLDISAYSGLSGDFATKDDLDDYVTTAAAENWDVQEYIGKDGIKVDNHEISISADIVTSDVLDDYYKKTETYNKEEVNGFIDGITDTFADIAAASGDWNKVTDKLDTTAFDEAIADYYKKDETSAASELEDKFDEVDTSIEALETTVASFGSYEVVPSTASVANPSTKIIYLVKDTSVTASDVYKEYIYVSAGQNPCFELIGDTSIDLTDYYTKDQTSAASELADAFDKIEDEIASITADYVTKEEAEDWDTETYTGGEGIQVTNHVISVSGDYVEQSELTDNYYTKTESDEKFQLTGDYVTTATTAGWDVEEYVGGNGIKVDNHEISVSGDYLTATALDNYYDKAAVDGYTAAISDTIAEMSGAVTASIAETTAWANNTFQPTGNYVTDSDLNSDLDNVSAWANGKFQEKGDYVTETTLETTLGDYATTGWAEEHFQPTGDYITTGTTAGWDVQEYTGADGISVENHVISVSGDYLTATALDDYYNKSEIDGYTAAISDTITAVSGEVDSKIASTTAWVDSNFQPTGNYVTSDELTAALDDYVTDTELSDTLDAYYTIAETSSNSQLDTKFAEVDDAITALENTVANFGSYEIVATTASVTDPSSKVIYLVKDTSVTGSDVYKEYIYVSAGQNPGFELIGDTSIDLSDYYTKGQTSAASELANKFDAIDEQISDIESDYIPTAASAGWDVAEYTAGTGIGIEDHVVSVTGDYVESSELSDYYKKDETSGKFELENAFNDIADQISDIETGYVATATTGNWDVVAYSGKDGIKVENHEISITAEYVEPETLDNYYDKTEIDTYSAAVAEQIGDVDDVVSVITAASADWNTVTAKLDTTAFSTVSGTFATDTELSDTSAAIVQLIPTDLFTKASADTLYYPLNDNPYGYLTEHQSLEDYYTKDETSGKDEISDALDNKQDAGNYLSANALDDIKSSSATWDTVTDKLDTTAFSTVSGDFVQTTALDDYQTVAGMTAYQTVDDMSGYYTKSETDAEISKIGAYLTAASTASITDPSTKVIYLVKDSSVSGDDKYFEYIYLSASDAFELIGSTSISLDDYVTTGTLDITLADYQTTANMDNYVTTADNSVLSSTVNTLTAASSTWDTVTDKLDTTEFSDVSGTFLTSEDLSDYYTKDETNTTLANYQPVSGMSAYQPSGDYVTTADNAVLSSTVNTLTASSATWDTVINKLDESTYSAESANFVQTTALEGYISFNDLQFGVI